MNLSNVSARQTLQDWASRAESSREPSAESRTGAGTVPSNAKGTDQIDTGPSPFLLAREHAARNFWQVREIENLESAMEALQQFAGEEVELDDPTLTDEHVVLQAAGVDIAYEDIDGELFVDGPSVFDIDQKQVGDCYLLAALASLAHTNPQAIRDMITDNGNGTYTVHFGGEAGNVTVDDDFAVDRFGNTVYADTGDAANPELWVAVIEKAYAQAGGGYEPIEGGWAHEAIADLTGHDDFTTAPPSEFTAQEIAQALAEGRSVTASSHAGDTGDKKRVEHGVVSNHAYAILDVREVDGETQIRVYNPWGNTEGGNDGVDDGAFWMSQDDFNASFRQVEMMNTPLPEAA